MTRHGAPSAPVAERTPQAAILPAPSWPAAEAHAELLLARRRRRGRRLALRLSLLVGLPTLLTALYFALLASPRYVSETELTYEIYRPPASLAAGITQSFSGTSETNNVDLGAIVYQYVRSPAILRRLDAAVQLRARFSDRHLDWWSRMSPHASAEAFLAAYRRRVSVSEGLGGYLTIDVATADPALSLALARAVVEACDQMVDAMTMRARNDEMSFAQTEVAHEEERMRGARLALAAFQDAHGDQDPERMASQLGSIVGTLEADLAAARTQLAQTAPFLGGDAPIRQQIRARITSLQAQLAGERQRLAGSNGTPFSQLLADYARLQLDQDFARTAYTAAEQGLAVARADAARKQNYLIDFAEPVLPDRADPFYALTVTLSVLIGTLIAYAVGSLLAGALRDQSGV